LQPKNSQRRNRTVRGCRRKRVDGKRSLKRPKLSTKGSSAPGRRSVFAL
jgi:hypothetical protein